MPDINFSLTEYACINPILGLRASPLKKLSLPENITYFLKSALLSRIIAVATSFFAAIDAFIHLLTTLIQTGHILCRKLGVSFLPLAPSKEQTIGHLQKSMKFLALTVIGSIAALVWPNVVKYFIGSTSGGTPPDGLKYASERVNTLWNHLNNPETFNKLWESASLEDKRVFTHILDGSTNDKTKVIKTIYEDAISTDEKICEEWKSQEEEVFYHATSLQGLEGILKSGKVEVRHEQAFCGAFVSTKPETGFGDYILVFKRNIERLSRLNHGFSVGNKAYWAGFSRDIPVNEKTLSKILVVSSKMVGNLEDNCKTWAGHEIEVAKLQPYLQIDGKTITPKEWSPHKGKSPKDGTQGELILKTLKIRAEQAKNLSENPPQKNTFSIWPSAWSSIRNISLFQRKQLQAI